LTGSVIIESPPPAHLSGAGQAGLLVDRRQDFQRAVHGLGVVGHGQTGGQADTVVGTQRGTFGLEPLAVDFQADRVFHKIELDIFVLLTHHIHVPLQDDRGGVLVARRRGDLDDHVAGAVGSRLEVAFLGEAQQIFAQLVLVPRGAGYLPDLVKLPPKILRLDIVNGHYRPPDCLFELSTPEEHYMGGSVDGQHGSKRWTITRFRCS
jgi:hypothetical protein